MEICLSAYNFVGQLFLSPETAVKRTKEINTAIDLGLG